MERERVSPKATPAPTHAHAHRHAQTLARSFGFSSVPRSRAKPVARANDITCGLQQHQPTAAGSRWAVATMYAGYGFPDFGLPGMYAQMNPGWFNAPYVLPHTQSQGIPCLQSPERAQQQPGQPDVRQQQRQQQQQDGMHGMHTSDPFDLDGDDVEMPDAPRAKPTMVSAGTQTVLSGEFIQAEGDEQGQRASGKRGRL